MSLHTGVDLLEAGPRSSQKSISPITAGSTNPFLNLVGTGEQAAASGDIKKALSFFVQALSQHPNIEGELFAPACRQVLWFQDTPFSHCRC